MAFFGFQSLFTNVIRKTEKNRDWDSRLRQTADVNLYHLTKFSPYFSFTLYCFYTKISSFMPVSTIGIVRDCFYLLIFYSEKFSTWVWRLPFAVNVNLNLSNLDIKLIFQSGTLSPRGVNKCFSFNQFIPVFHVTMFPPSGLTRYYTSEKQDQPVSGDYGFALCSRCTRQRPLWLHGSVSVTIPVSSVGGVCHNTTILLVLPL